MKYNELLKELARIVGYENTGNDDEFDAEYICTRESHKMFGYIFYYVKYNEEKETIILSDIETIKNYYVKAGKNFEQAKDSLIEQAKNFGIKFDDNEFILEIYNEKELENSLNVYKNFIVPVVQNI